MNKKLAVGILGFLLLIGSIFIAKRNMGNEPLSNRLQVAASFYPLYFFAQQIGGDKANVFNITPASVEPHEYELTAQDVAHISNAQMLIVNGKKLEAWGDKIKDQLKGTNTLIVTVGEGLANKQMEEEGKRIQDPHVWLDPVLAKEEVAIIEKAYEKIDPTYATYFQANAKKLKEQISQLDIAFNQGLSHCQKKNFVTSHAAFGYLAARYGITQVAISGVSPDQEPSSQKLAEVVNLIKKEDIKIVFFESLVSPKLSQTIAQETGAHTMVLDPIEGLTKEDLSRGKNYFTVMRTNLVALQIALQCSK